MARLRNRRAVVVFDLPEEADDEELVLFIQQALERPDQPQRMYVRKITYAGDTYIFEEEEHTNG